VNEAEKVAVERLEANARRNLKAAIETMRNALYEAKRAVEVGSALLATQHVMHELAWGHANVVSSIDAAMHYLDDARDFMTAAKGE
jgi:hypothetical protein